MEVALNSTFNLGMFMLKIACTNSWSNRRKVVRFCLNIDWIVYSFQLIMIIIIIITQR